ncbi:glycosyltransferase family 39 protein, partial [bacterium]|nr:glycosyltransferase family 39 protein [bacterium]
MIFKQPEFLLPVFKTGSRITNSLKNENGKKIIVIAFLLLLGGTWRIYDSYRLDIWLDEAFSLHTAHGSLSATWDKAVNFEIQPPVYFLLLNLWTRVSSTIEFARLLSVLFSLLSIFFIYRTWKLLFGGEWDWLVPTILVFHSFHLWAASEARGYAAVILFTSASTYYFFKLLASKNGQRPAPRHFAFYIICSLLGIFTNYYCGFLLLGHFLASMFWFERRTFWRLQFCYLVIVLFLLAWLPVLHMQLTLRPHEDPANEFVFKSGTQILNDFAFLIRPIYWVAKVVMFWPTPSLASKISIFILFVLFLAALGVMRMTLGRKKFT